MSKEQDRRAAILESLRAGKTAKEIVDWFGYSKTQVYEIAKTYREADNKDDVTSDRASHSKRSDRKRTGEFIDQLKDRIDQSPGTSMAKLAKDMGVHRATVSRAVHQDLHYKSYVLRRRQLLTDAMKVNRKIKCQALLNDIKHESAHHLRFFTDEKNFIQDRKVNRQNDRWICEDASDVPTVMHTKFPASVMVLGVVSSDGDVMPPYFFEQGLKINAAVYIHVLETVVKPWMDRVADGREYVFQQDSAPAHKARVTQAWLHTNVPYHWSPDLWPPSSPDCNPLDYYVWGVVEAEVNNEPHNRKDALRKKITAVMTNMNREELARACRRFRSRLEQVVEANGDYIE